jgi:F-box protein 3
MQGNGGRAGVDPLPLANGSAAGGSGPGPSSSSTATSGPAVRPLQRCQLESRHWRILGPGGELVNEVSGEGVIGEYPALEAGGREFPYQSCTHQAERLGFMEGGFAFVEGSLARPEGPAFTAVCPRFELRVPDFIY